MAEKERSWKKVVTSRPGTVLSEGYVRKGGVNNTSQIKARPPAPAPIKTSTSAGQISSGVKEK